MPIEYALESTRNKYCLNGLWEFSCEGTSINEIPSTWDEEPIKVPSPYNVNSFNRSHVRRYAQDDLYVQGGDFRLYPEYPEKWEKAKCGFYRRSFAVPSEFIGKRVFLRFEAVAFHCKFYVNGKMLLESMEAFLPLEIEVTDVVKFGEENEIVVACESAGYLTYKGLDGRNRLDHPRGSFWGEFIAGIWQDAWLVARPQQFIDDVFAVTDVEAHTLTLKTEVKGTCDGASLTYKLQKWQTDVQEKTILTGASLNQDAVWTYQEGEVDLWDSFQPNLYWLKAQLVKDGEVLDEKIIRIGFRTMRADGEKFVLNGKKIQLKIDAWHYLGYSIQTEEYARSYYKMAKDAGVNIIRLHAEPFPEFFIDIADEMGMLIVSESAVWASHCMFSYNDDFFKNSRNHLVNMLLRDRNHPSVVMWSPENECIPAYMFCGSDVVKSIPELEEKIYDFLKVIYDYDTSRLISCDGSGDLGGRLPVNSLHYPHYDCPTHRGKPITIGEMGSMYYSTPDTITKEFGKEAIETFDGRLESVSEDAFQDLIGERKWASQICVFNMIWYGLRPLPFKDRAITWDDYTTPGIKPSRITPYLRTLNAGAEEGMPEYVPNPVWLKVKDAYLPERTFVEHLPSALYTGMEQSFQITSFNDDRDGHTYRIEATLEGKTEILDVEIPAAEYREDFACFVIDEEGQKELVVKMFRDGQLIHEVAYFFVAVSKDQIEKTIRATGVEVVTEGEAPLDRPYIDCRQVSPYQEYMRGERQQHFFSADGETKWCYGKMKEIHIFDSSLLFNANYALLDGSGNAIALDLTPAGEKRMMCGLPLGDDAVSALILLDLATRLQKAVVAEAPKPYFLGDPMSRTATLLNELGCEVNPITKEDMPALLREKQETLLIVDGSADFDDYKLLSHENFKQVLLTDVSKIPEFMRSELTLSNERLYQLVPSIEAEHEWGLKSNALYGMEPNREAPLCDRTLVARFPSESIMWHAPSINWMAWNNVAEPIKTVAIMRTEKEDQSLKTGLYCKEYAGSSFYITTLIPDLDSLKLKNIWARLLSKFNVRIEMHVSNEVADLMFSSLYGQQVRRMLYKPMAEGDQIDELCPGLNATDGQNIWSVVDGKKEKGAGWYAIYVNSPQDRRDLLLNPDFIDLEIDSKVQAKVYLNGDELWEGTNGSVTGIPLVSGENLLIVRVAENTTMPIVRFKRVKTPMLDLKFGLFTGELKPISMQGVTYFGSVNNTYASHASFTRDHFWSTNCPQRNGIYLDFTFPEAVSPKAFWFVAVKFHNEGDIYLPRKFRLWAGDDADHLKVVYTSLDEKDMYYPKGRVFWSLTEKISAKAYRFELLDEKIKEFVMADLTLFSN